MDSKTIFVYKAVCFFLVILQDLSDEKLFKRLYDIKPSIIIDDASHYISYQIKALYHLFPALNAGGIYIIEDLAGQIEMISFIHEGGRNVCVDTGFHCTPKRNWLL